MAQRSVREVVVKKLFAAKMEAGDDKGEKVFISPTDTKNLKYLSDAQLAAYQNSGSIVINDDVTVNDGAEAPIGSVYIDIRPAKSTARTSTATEAK